jgi:hypothetical protein
MRRRMRCRPTKRTRTKSRNSARTAARCSIGGYRERRSPPERLPAGLGDADPPDDPPAIAKPRRARAVRMHGGVWTAFFARPATVPRDQRPAGDVCSRPRCAHDRAPLPKVPMPAARSPQSHVQPLPSPLRHSPALHEPADPLGARGRPGAAFRAMTTKRKVCRHCKRPLRLRKLPPRRVRRDVFWAHAEPGAGAECRKLRALARHKGKK